MFNKERNAVSEEILLKLPHQNFIDMKYLFLLLNILLALTVSAQKNKKATFVGKLNPSDFQASPLPKDSCLLECIYLENSKTRYADSSHYKVLLNNGKATYFYKDGQRDIKYQVAKNDRKNDMTYYITFIKGSPESYMYDIDSIDLEKKLIYVRIHSVNKKGIYREWNRAIFRYSQ